MVTFNVIMEVRNITLHNKSNSELYNRHSLFHDYIEAVSSNEHLNLLFMYMLNA